MRFFILLTSICFFTSGNLISQPTNINFEIDALLQSKFEASIDYLNSFKVDSAGLILDSILIEIEGTKIYNTPFGLRVQLRKAEVLERDNEGDLALLALQEVKEKALKSKVWDVYVYSCINLGLVYEKIGKHADCIQHLRNAQKILDKHPELDYIYPFFCVRISSYHRIYANRDSARYYALECLRTYEKHDEYAQGGDGYMLMAMLSGNEDPDAKLKYAEAAVEIFEKLENHNALGYMIRNISGFYYSKKDYDKALIYNDSTISAAKRSIQGGFDVYHSLYTAYKFRGEILNKLGQRDSAYYYVKKGYELHNQHVQKENTNKVLEMDAKYKDNKNAQKIKEQADQLKSAKVQRWLLLIIFGLVILFTTGLIFYYNKLRTINRQTKFQANQIKQKNKELSVSLNKQIVLQGEVHHRVKNNLQVIISLLDLQKEELINEEAKVHIDSMSKRIYSMAAIHNLLYQKEDMEFIKLYDYVENLCYHFSHFSLEQDKPIFTLNTDDINLNLETSMPIGIIITELLTNSLKHARIVEQKLRIAIKIKQMDDGIIISYKDNGPGFEENKDKIGSNGLGFYILESMTRQLQGKMIRKNDNGAIYEIHLVEKNKWKGEEFFTTSK